jgi:hypothetical protein
MVCRDGQDMYFTFPLMCFQGPCLKIANHFFCSLIFHIHIYKKILLLGVQEIHECYVCSTLIVYVENVLMLCANSITYAISMVMSQDAKPNMSPANSELVFTSSQSNKSHVNVNVVPCRSSPAEEGPITIYRHITQSSTHVSQLQAKPLSHG